MEYSEEQIESAKADASPNALAYIEELETRLSLVNGTVNEFLVNLGFSPMAEIHNDAVLSQKREPSTLTHTNGHNASGEYVHLSVDSVSWASEIGDMTFYVKTPEEARALYRALLAITSAEID